MSKLVFRNDSVVYRNDSVVSGMARFIIIRLFKVKLGEITLIVLGDGRSTAGLSTDHPRTIHGGPTVAKHDLSHHGPSLVFVNAGIFFGTAFLKQLWSWNVKWVFLEKRGSTLASKPRADVARCQKQE